MEGKQRLHKQLRQHLQRPPVCVSDLVHDTAGLGTLPGEKVSYLGRGVGWGASCRRQMRQAEQGAAGGLNPEQQPPILPSSKRLCSEEYGGALETLSFTETSIQQPKPDSSASAAAVRGVWKRNVV